MWKIQRPFELNSSPEGVLRISSDRDDQMGDKIQNPKKSLGLQKKKKTQKNHWTKIYPPKNPMPNFLAIMNDFQEA